jgi:RHS repeat-associated protein
MVGRSGLNLEYRYGYQGSEKDDEIKGNGNSYTTEFRMLDPRIGRWLSIDPVFQPWQSPYSSMDNNPISKNDVLGNVANDWIGKKSADGSTTSWKFDKNVKSPEDLPEGYTEYAKPGKKFRSANKDQNGEAMWVQLGENGNWDYTTPDANGQQVTQQGMPIDEGYSDQECRAAYFNQFNSMVDNGAMAYFQIMTLPLNFEASGFMTFGSMTSKLSTQYLTTSLTRTAIDATAQVAAKGYKKYDLIDNLGSGFLTPGYSAVFGGAIDVRPFEKQYNVVGINKTFYRAALDTGLKYTFSSQGWVGKYASKSYPVGAALDKFAPQLSPVINGPLSISSKIFSSKLLDAIFK